MYRAERTLARSSPTAARAFGTSHCQRLSGATPTSAATALRSRTLGHARFPSSGRSARRLKVATGPMPGTLPHRLRLILPQRALLADAAQGHRQISFNWRSRKAITSSMLLVHCRQGLRRRTTSEVRIRVTCRPKPTSAWSSRASSGTGGRASIRRCASPKCAMTASVDPIRSSQYATWDERKVTGRGATLTSATLDARRPDRRAEARPHTRPWPP